MVCLYNEEDKYKMEMTFDFEAFSEFLDKFFAGKQKR